MRKRKKEIALPEYTEKFLQGRNFLVFQMPNSHQTMNCNSSSHACISLFIFQFQKSSISCLSLQSSVKKSLI